MLRFITVILFLSFCLQLGNGQNTTASSSVSTAAPGSETTSSIAGSSTVTVNATTTTATSFTTVGPTGGLVGRCPIRPAANVSIDKLNGQWHVLRYQPDSQGPLPDRCDVLQINANNQGGQMILSAIPVEFGSDGYQTETATIRAGSTAGTFQYSIPYYGLVIILQN
ncbi:hypothetical protein CHUAL_010708 [Chamberlinius hualienensis]